MRRLAFPVLLGAGTALAGVATAAILVDSVTLQPRATVLRSGEFTVGVDGQISSGAEGEYVVVRGKECGIPGAFFRALGGGTTLAGGRYEASVMIRTKTTLRAEWKAATSSTAVVTPRAHVVLTKKPGGFEVGVASEAGPVDGKRIRLERLTPAGWKLLQTVVVKTEDYNGWAEKDNLRFKVPKGTTIRAVLPRRQAGPCYLAGYSKLLRT